MAHIFSIQRLTRAEYGTDIQYTALTSAQNGVNIYFTTS